MVPHQLIKFITILRDKQSLVPFSTIYVIYYGLHSRKTYIYNKNNNQIEKKKKFQKVISVNNHALFGLLCFECVTPQTTHITIQGIQMSRNSPLFSDVDQTWKETQMDELILSIPYFYLDFVKGDNFIAQ